MVTGTTYFYLCRPRFYGIFYISSDHYKILTKKVFYMIKNFRFLVLGILFFGVSDTVILAQKKKDSSKIKGKYRVHIPYLSMSREFFENMWKNHPAFCTAFVGGVIGGSLYADKILEARLFIHDHRNIVTTGIFAALVAAYWHKEKLFNYDFEDVEDCDDESCESECITGFSKFSQSGVRIFRPGEIKTVFANVAGLETVKEDLSDILMFLKNPEKFTAIGAKVPKGVLLSGAPGNGKTLIARALAGEAGCPFLYITASEFVEAIVGVGASRVRDLFKIARDLAPCIIFVDEIDTIGRRRSMHSFGGDTELTQTLNQILAEMDGFEQNETPIIIIGATNRPDVLDEALLRPGRFDRHISIHMPFIKDRCDILQVHLKRVKTGPDIDAYKIALGTQGFSGADLAKLVNEAAIIAVREQSPHITMHHVDQARDYMWMGRATKGMERTKEEQWKTAIHESGHTLCTVYQKDATPLFKVTIEARGDALGITFTRDVRERYGTTEQEMRAAIVMVLGGSVAEEMIFGMRGVGASSDLEYARKLATEMVMLYGMSAEFKDVSFSDFIYNQVHLPDEISTKLHQEVAKIIHDCRKITEDILTQHKEKLFELSELLMVKGTVYAQDVYALCEVEQPVVIGSLAN